MLRVLKLSKLYSAGDKVIPVLKNISFSLDSGEFTFLTGASGSGKTTLMKLLIRQELPTKGSIIFETVPIEELPQHLIPSFRRTIGVMFQDFKLIENKTVFENVAFVLEILDIPKKEVKDTVNQLLEYVGLVDKQNLFPKQLSGGEKRRVVIARAIANNPKLLIADEPTGDLDPDNSAHIMELLKKINKAGTSVIMTTHDMDLIKIHKDFEHWHLNSGELIFPRAKIQSDSKDFLKSLSKIVPEPIIEKLMPLHPDEKDDLLGLTTGFLRDTLKLTTAEIELLTNKLRDI